MRDPPGLGGVGEQLHDVPVWHIWTLLLLPEKICGFKNSCKTKYDFNDLKNK